MISKLQETTDAAALVDLVNSAYRGDSSKAGWTTEAEFLDGIRLTLKDAGAMLQDSTKKVLVLEEKGALLACVCLENRGAYAYLGMLTVSPELQGKGIGKDILRECETWIQKHWHSTVWIEMSVLSQRKELIAFYVRQGYQLTEERKPFPGYQEPQRYGIPKRPDLEFAVLKKKLSVHAR